MAWDGPHAADFTDYLFADDDDQPPKKDPNDVLNVEHRMLRAYRRGRLTSISSATGMVYGHEELAVRKGNRIYFQKVFTTGSAISAVTYGNGNSEGQYLAGDFNGARKDEIAIRRGNWLLLQGKITDSVVQARVVFYGNGASEAPIPCRRLGR